MKKDFGMNSHFRFCSSWVKIKFSNNYVEQLVYTAYAHVHYLKLLTQQLLVLSLSKLTKNIFLFPRNFYVEINTCYWIDFCL